MHPPSKNNLTRDQNLSGAGRGNRTLVGSLGSYCSTIKLYPLRAADFVPDVRRDLKFFFKNVWVTCIKQACVGAGLPAIASPWYACPTEVPASRASPAPTQAGVCRVVHFRSQRHGVSGPGDTAIGWPVARVSGTPPPPPCYRGTPLCAPCPGSVRWPARC